MPIVKLNEGLISSTISGDSTTGECSDFAGESGTVGSGTMGAGGAGLETFSSRAGASELQHPPIYIIIYLLYLVVFIRSPGFDFDPIFHQQVYTPFKSLWG